MPGDHARSALAGTRFADVRWARTTGSTNADAIELGRQGAREGIVVVADHQTAGRGRRGRTWTAPEGASLLASILLRPPVGVMDATAMAVAVAAAAAVEEVAGFAPRLKWPNDLVWPGDGSTSAGGGDRKLAGVLAEADWPPGAEPSAGWRRPDPHERATVVVGIGINVNWPAEHALPEELQGLAVACNHVAGHDVDRERLLVALLRRLDADYARLVAAGDGRVQLQDAWRARSATLGRRVRVDLGADDIEGTALDITPEGHLVVELLEGGTRTVAVGDVVHLRPA